ncbi:MAG: hypothetical protein KGL39_26215 [Patescibacteria group bacterium]|nr:hypothetical protein [Patescibacteria group bacterium]
MSARVNATELVTLPKSGALGNYLRVVLAAGLAVLAGPNERELGVTDQNYLASGLGQGNFCAVVHRRAPGTVNMVASGAITQYADVYADVNGKVSATPAGYYIGVAMTGTSNDGDYVEVLRSDDRAGLLYVNQAAGATVTNTVTETAFAEQFTFPANTLKVGDVIRIRAQALCTNTHLTDTLTLKLYIGATNIVATAAVDVATSDIGIIDCTLVVRTVGATGTFVAAGVQGLGTPGTVTAKPFNLASTAIDTTAAQLVKLTATWSVADPTNVVECDILTIARDVG